MDPDDFKNEYLKIILNRLDSLEKRIGILESDRGLYKNVQIPDSKEEEKEEEGPEFSDINISLSSIFETRLGEYGLAWLGNIVLFFAIAFLWQYFNDAGKPFISFAVGVVSVTGVFILSHYLRKSFTYLSYMFNLFAFIILFFIHRFLRFL